MKKKKFNGKELRRQIQFKATELQISDSLVRQDIRKKIKITKQTLSGYERGRFTPPADKQIWFAEYFNIALEEFYKEV